MSDLGKEYSNIAAKAYDHPLVKGVLDEFALNNRLEREGLVEYGLAKIVNAVGQVSIAIAMGIDPDELRATPEEQAAEMMRRLERLADAGVPTTLIVVPDANA